MHVCICINNYTYLTMLCVKGSGPQTQTRALWWFVPFTAGRWALSKVSLTLPLMPAQDLWASDRIWETENLGRKVVSGNMF